MSRYLVFRPPEKIAFRHNFFGTFPEIQFRREANGTEPVAAFRMGDQQFALPFVGLKREFGLSEYTADAVMLNTIASALDFVTIMQLGDDIPPEVLTGEASWQPDAAHIARARRRVTAELVGWSQGTEVPRENAVAQQQFVAEYVNDESIRFSLLRLAASMGEGTHYATTLSKTVDHVSEEFAYIEALREQTTSVAGIAIKIRNMRGEFKHHSSIMAELDPVARMIVEPVRQFRTLITKVDDRVADITTVMEHFELVQQEMREVRDDLTRRLSPWVPFRERWDQIAAHNADPFTLVPALRDMYRFLAPRHMPVDEWKLVLSRGEKERDAKTYGSVVTWYERGEPSAA